jgi:hypothetical protein
LKNLSSTYLSQLPKESDYSVVCYVNFFFHLPLDDAYYAIYGTVFFTFFTPEVFTQINSEVFFPRMDNTQYNTDCSVNLIDNKLPGVSGTT